MFTRELIHMLEANSALTIEKSVLSAYSNQGGVGVFGIYLVLRMYPNFFQFAFLFNLSIFLFELD